MKMTQMALAAATALVFSPLAFAQVDVNAPPAQVTTGPAGTEINAPSTNVQTGPGGVDVNAAGVHVGTNRVGPNPSVNINVPQAGLNLNVPAPAARVDVNGRPTGPIRNAIRGAVGANNPDRWRYKWHNGEWWYYTPQNSWMYHRDNNWSAYDQGTYSYRPGYGSARYETAYRGLRGRRYSANPAPRADVHVNAPGANVDVGGNANSNAPRVNVDAGPGGADVNVNPNNQR